MSGVDPLSEPPLSRFHSIILSPSLPQNFLFHSLSISFSLNFSLFPCLSVPFPLLVPLHLSISLPPSFSVALPHSLFSLFSISLFQETHPIYSFLTMPPPSPTFCLSLLHSLSLSSPLSVSRFPTLCLSLPHSVSFFPTTLSLSSPLSVFFSPLSLSLSLSISLPHSLSLLSIPILSLFSQVFFDFLLPSFVLSFLFYHLRFLFCLTINLFFSLSLSLSLSCVFT